MTTGRSAQVSGQFDEKTQQIESVNVSDGSSTSSDDSLTNKQVPQARGPINSSGGSPAAVEGSAVAPTSQAGRSADEEPSAHRQRVRASLPDDESADSHLLADMNEAKEAGEAAVRNSLARLFVGVKEPGMVNRVEWERLSKLEVQQADRIARLKAYELRLIKEINVTKHKFARVREDKDMKYAHIRRLANSTNAQEAEQSWLRLLADMKARNEAFELEVEDLEKNH